MKCERPETNISSFFFLHFILVSVVLPEVFSFNSFFHCLLFGRNTRSPSSSDEIMCAWWMGYEVECRTTLRVQRLFGSLRHVVVDAVAARVRRRIFLLLFSAVTGISKYCWLPICLWFCSLLSLSSSDLTGVSKSLYDPTNDSFWICNFLHLLSFCSVTENWKAIHKCECMWNLWAYTHTYAKCVYICYANASWRQTSHSFFFFKFLRTEKRSQMTLKHAIFLCILHLLVCKMPYTVVKLNKEQ